MKTSRYLLLVALMTGAIHANADVLGDAINACLNEYPRLEQRPARSACYDEAERSAAREAAKASVAAGRPVAAASRLDTLWRSDSPHSVQLYRQNALMLTHSDRPNNMPTSPNPANTVPRSFPLDQTEAKFQLSLKTLAIDSTQLPLLGAGNSLWMAYTQQSNWQIADSQNSRPFRESNYAPEVILSHRFDRELDGFSIPAVYGFEPRLLNIGAVHQSNGQSLPRSRSWNRVYAQLGLEKSLAGGDSVAVLLRPWVRVRENRRDDDNPDIEHYLGHGDMEFQYWRGRSLLTLLARSRALQADLSLPLLDEKSLMLHFQYFTGYGESLIDYNQRHSVFGIGVSLPYPAP